LKHLFAFDRFPRKRWELVMIRAASDVQWKLALLIRQVKLSFGRGFSPPIPHTSRYRRNRGNLLGFLSGNHLWFVDSQSPSRRKPGTMSLQFPNLLGARHRGRVYEAVLAHSFIR
jgi:hypothetical protein